MKQRNQPKRGKLPDDDGIHHCTRELRLTHGPCQRGPRGLRAAHAHNDPPLRHQLVPDCALPQARHHQPVPLRVGSLSAILHEVIVSLPPCCRWRRRSTPGNTRRRAVNPVMLRFWSADTRIVITRRTFAPGQGNMLGNAGGAGINQVEVFREWPGRL